MGYFSSNKTLDVDALRDSQEEQKLQKSIIDIKIYVDENDVSKNDNLFTTICIKEDLTGVSHVFKSVREKEDSDKKSFISYLGSETAALNTLSNFIDCLLLDPFFKENFDIEILPFLKGYLDKPLAYGDYTVRLTSKEYGKLYDCSIDIKNEHPEYIIFCSEVKKSNSNNLYEIADVDVPQEITLSNNPNFVIFRNVTVGQGAIPSQIDIEVKCYLRSPVKGQFTILLVEDMTGKKHTFKGIADASKLDNTSFLVENLEIPSALRTTYNLRECLMRDDYIRNNFNIIVIPPTKKDEFQSCGEECFYSIGGTIRLISKGYGQQYNCTVSVEDSVAFDILTVKNQKSIGTDTIDNGRGDYKIELDIYTDTGVEWGKQVDNLYAIGTYLTTLSKSYFGKPLWFELNTLMSKRGSYSPLFLTAFDKRDATWVNTGTMIDYRFVARRTGRSNTEPIYFSDVLYTINGYDYTLNDSHLGYDDTEVDNYTLDLSKSMESDDFRKVKPLTTNLERTHIRGQKQYLNCILKNRSEAIEEKVELAILYKIYTQSGRKIDEVVNLQMSADDMHVMNTTQLNLDQFLPVYKDKTVGQIDVCLVSPIDDNPTKKHIEVSENISYRILPSGLHTVHDFAFLNRLGGWDSMNFGGSTSNEFKVTSSSIFKTLQPGFKHYSEIESVSSKVVEEKLTVQSSPLTYDVVEWLREMSASPAVYELSTRRYVLIDDMSLKYNSKDDLFQIDLKYHYSDVFNGRMK